GRGFGENRAPAAVDGLVATLPPATRQLLDELSPATHLARLRAPLFLIHGRDDPAVPFTESLRLARAARQAHRPVTTTIIGSVSPAGAGRRARFAGVWRLGHELFRVRSHVPPRRLTGSQRGGPSPMSFIASRTGS